MVTKFVTEKPGLTLTAQEAPMNPPAEDEIQVAIAAVGLNPIDANLAQRGHPAWRYPHVLGLDAVGRITDIGAHAGNLRVGQRVLWHGDMATDGVLAQRVNVPAAAVCPLSDEIDDLRAAALPCAGIAAWQAVERMELKPKQTVLIEAGAGGVGYYAIQLAKRKGVKVVTTASPQHHHFLGAVGADWTIDYAGQDVAAVIRETVGELDAVLDSVGGATSARDLGLLRRGGHYVSLLGAPQTEGVDLFRLAPSIHIVGVGGAYSDGMASAGRELSPILEKLVTLMAEGELQSPTIERVKFDADSVSAALERELSGKMAGKQVVVLET